MPWLPVPWLWALALLAAAGYAAAEWTLLGGSLGFPLDDSWIHLQFARNLAAGHGLSYNPGELVTGSTAPLWTALLSLLFLLPGGSVAGPAVGAKVLGVALYAAGVAATYRLGRELDLPRPLAAFAAALTLGTYWLVWSALSGMEIPLFTLLSLWGMILHLRERKEQERPPLALGVLGLAALARPEGLLLLALAMLDRLLSVERRGGGIRLLPPPWRRLAPGLGLAALALAPTVLFYWVVGGSPLPTTFAAKGAGAYGWLPNPRYLHVVFGIFFKPQPYMALAAAGGALALVRRLGTRRDRGLLPALWVAALPLAYSLLSPPGRGVLVGNFGRYFFPLFPPLIVLGTLALASAATTLGSPWRAGRLRLPLPALVAALMLWPTAATLLNNAPFYARNVANVEASDVRLAHWLRENVPAEAVLAVEDIGAIGYLTQNRVLDLVGLTSPRVSGYVREAVGPEDPRGDRGVLRFLAEERPDLVIVFTNWRPELMADRRLFQPLLSLEIQDNITMGGDEIVVYRTPWSRHLPASPAPGATAIPGPAAPEEGGEVESPP